MVWWIELANQIREMLPFNHLNWKRKQIGAGWCSCLYTKKSGESWLDYFGFNSN